MSKKNFDYYAKRVLLSIVILALIPVVSYLFPIVIGFIVVTFNDFWGTYVFTPFVDGAEAACKIFGELACPPPSIDK